jgi:hypothetical protein
MRTRLAILSCAILTMIACAQTGASQSIAPGDSALLAASMQSATHGGVDVGQGMDESLRGELHVDVQEIQLRQGATDYFGARGVHLAASDLAIISREIEREAARTGRNPADVAEEVWGRLRLFHASSVPSGARVYINDEPSGKVTNDAYPLPDGSVRIMMTLDGRRCHVPTSAIQSPPYEHTCRF